MFTDQGLTNDEITAKISNLMLDWYREFTNGKFTSVCSEAFATSEHEENNYVEATYDSCQASGNIEETPLNPSPDRAQMYNFPSVQEPPVSIAIQSYSLDAVKHDVRTLIINPLVEAEALPDPDLYCEQLFIAAKQFPHSLQSALAHRSVKS
jgi:hypothetical protein